MRDETLIAQRRVAFLQDENFNLEAKLHAKSSEYERLKSAVEDTFCDDVPCSRCDHLRAALSGTTDQCPAGGPHTLSPDDTECVECGAPRPEPREEDQ